MLERISTEPIASRAAANSLWSRASLLSSAIKPKSESAVAGVLVIVSIADIHIVAPQKWGRGISARLSRSPVRSDCAFIHKGYLKAPASLYLEGGRGFFVYNEDLSRRFHRIIIGRCTEFLLFREKAIILTPPFLSLRFCGIMPQEF